MGQEGVCAMRFAALDFETADHGADSACAVAIVRVEGQRIVERVEHLIRPPRRQMMFTWVHGITWNDVKDKPHFAELWPQISGLLRDVDFIAAHNAPFDKGVLRACCEAAGVAVPAPGFLCTVRLARTVWNLRPTKLPDVCRYLGIHLNHHNALSDAEACAQIVISAAQDGSKIRIPRA